MNVRSSSWVDPRVRGTIRPALLLLAGLLAVSVPGGAAAAPGPATSTQSGCARAAAPGVPTVTPATAGTASVGVAADPQVRVTGAGAAMVRDIDPSGGSAPQWVTPFRGGVAFSARDDGRGRELWFADASGARRLKDIRPGTASSDPKRLTVVGDKLFFSATDGSRGRELWVTDGTTAGTRRVRDIRPGAKGSNPDFLTAFKGRLYFAAGDGSHGRELWRSDGTTAGTKLVKDIQAHGSSLYRSGFREPQPWVVFKGHLYFAVQFDHLGLWRTDGTPAGTRRVYANVYPRNLLATSARLFFVGLYPGGGCVAEDLLWTSDGTKGGTKPVAGIYTDVPVVAFEGRAYFVQGFDQGRRLWRSSGTWNVHGQVKPKVPIDAGSGLLALGHALFLAQDGGLSISDGTGVGTTPLGAAIPDWSARVDVVRLAGRWYFPAGQGGAASDLWQTDGTPGGTTLAASIGPVGGSEVRGLVKSGGAVWFTADDGSHGRELWRYDP